MAIESTFGAAAGVSARDSADLAARVTGAVITREHDRYDTARRVWNGMILRRPAVIVRCADADDVAAAIAFARARGLWIAVRGGGHNVAGTAVCDSGLVIDLSGMRGGWLDPSRRTVHAAGGATWRDVDEVTQPHGLATPGGVVSSTGVAGLALSGGVSNQRRAHGMTIDNLVSAEVVTAEGRRVRCSAGEHADLHWALRGGGGNFGVVTSLELAVHRLGPEVYALDVAYPIEHAAEVLRRWRHAVADAPDELTTDAMLWSLPVIPDVPAHLRGRPYVGIAGMYAGDPAVGERLTRGLRSLATPLLDVSGPMPYLDLQASMDAFFPRGLRYYWKALYLDDFGDAAIAEIVARQARRPSSRTLTVIRHLGGAMARVGPGDTAFGDRDADYMLSVDSTWRDPRNDARNLRWTRDFWAAMRRFSRGKTYFNFPGLLEEGQAAIEESYGANHARLARVKAAYDPDNVFRLNQNIRPAADRAAGR
jgi:FAD/FMN-containing dehydrogenase